MKISTFLTCLCLSFVFPDYGAAQAKECYIDGVTDENTLKQLGQPANGKLQCYGEPGTFTIVDGLLSDFSFAVEMQSVKSKPVCAVPISVTDDEDFRSVGLAEFYVSANGDSKRPCTFSYIGDGRLLTAGHCLWDDDVWQTPVKDSIRIGYGSDTVNEGCRATQLCVPKEWKESRHPDRDLGFIRVADCAFGDDEPTPLTVKAMPIDEIKATEKVRFTGYYPHPAIEKATCFYFPMERIWTSNQSNAGVYPNGNGGGLLCHNNSTVDGSSGSPITDEARENVYCVHTYGHRLQSDCLTEKRANACTIITDKDEAASTGNPMDWDYVCKDF